VTLDLFPTCSTDSGRRIPRIGHRGLSLIEVLISMFVLSVGLLGVASLLPVGQIQIAKGETAEQQRNVAEAAFGQIRASWLNPANWYHFSSTGATRYDATAAGDYTYAGGHYPDTPTRLLFTVGANPTATNIPPAIALPSGYRSLAGAILEFRTGRLRGIRRRVTGGSFTISALPAGLLPEPGDLFVVIRNQPFAIDPLYIAANNTADPSVDRFLSSPGMHRISAMSGPTTSGRLTSMAVAEHAVLSRDDLVFVEQEDDPTSTGIDESGPAQLFYFEAGGSTAPSIKRQSTGDYSWLATFVPEIPNPTNDPTGRANDTVYNVSVAVFQRRPVRDLTAEREVALTFTAGGYGGGFARLTSSSAANLEDVAADEWLFAGRSDGMVFKWYRILSVTEVQQSGSEYVREVTLAGADWPEAVNTTVTAKLFVGCVGVYQRSMQVDQLLEYPLPPTTP